jgi:hypothetical protein
VDQHFEALEHLDWSNLEEVATANETLLRHLASDRSRLRNLLEGLANDAGLLSMCEHYDLLDKLVLARGNRQDFRLRLHVFLPGYFDRPHNHRWSYSSLILRGSYRHVIYGQDVGLADDIDVGALQPIMTHRQRADDFYTLHHSLIHAVIAEPYTVSLIIRGPSQKARFLVMDRLENRAWWQYGMASETPQERETKVMSQAHLSALIAKLADLAIA